MPNRAERRLCKKMKHPWVKQMPDGSVVCTGCETVIQPAPEEQKPQNS